MIAQVLGGKKEIRLIVRVMGEGTANADILLAPFSLNDGDEIGRGKANSHDLPWLRHRFKCICSRAYPSCLAI
jgi:hypothetical protein